MYYPKEEGVGVEQAHVKNQKLVKMTRNWSPHKKQINDLVHLIGSVM